jgi:hypothetical protein
LLLTWGGHGRSKVFSVLRDPAHNRFSVHVVL